MTNEIMIINQITTTSTDVKREAWRQLKKQNPSNEHLRRIIRYTYLRQEAGEQLMKQNPSNEDLCCLIEYTDLKQEAAIMLRNHLGLKAIDEKALMKEIAERVVSQAHLLTMGYWHCGTSHCIGGWLCLLNEQSKEAEQKYGTQTVACALLPSYAHLFYESHQRALQALSELLS